MSTAVTPYTIRHPGRSPSPPPDGAATVAALLASAPGDAPGAEVTPVEERTVGDLVVHSGYFGIAGGGWEFTVESVQGADDAEATIYVTSGAD